MSALKGNVSDLKKLGARLNKFPTTIVASVASKTAPKLTTNANSAFTSGRTVYGQTRPPSTSGQPLTLRRTGATEATLRFVAIGTIVRCVLGTPYAKYLIGNYRVLPMGRMPVQWSRDINDLVQRERF
jgi:hypothetical protein